MAENSHISWTTHTWNPFRGCNHVSPGCLNCYADRHIAGRYKGDFKHLVRASKHTFNLPLRLAKHLPADAPLHERLIFPCSLSDFFHKQADAWRPEAWKIIRDSPFVYQILTKRLELVPDRLPNDWGDGYPNVWLGTSIENQEMAELRIPLLTAIPAQLRFLSVEPLLEKVDLFPLLGGQHYGATEHYKGFRRNSPIHWVVLGGESGNENGNYRYRPCEIEWIEAVLEDAFVCDIPAWMKQTGTWLAKKLELNSRHGTDPDEWPEWLQEQQLPHYAYSPTPV